MTIINVDCDTTDLQDLDIKLKTIFPEYEVVSFSNPLSAIKFIQQNGMDILFTDIRLKPIDGYELIKITMETNRFFSVIVSGHKDHPDDLTWMHINAHLSKPVTTGELVWIKQQVLRREHAMK